MLYPVCPTCQLLLADKQIPYEEGYQKIMNNDSTRKIIENKKINKCFFVKNRLINILI